jgi:hypothetical protein
MMNDQYPCYSHFHPPRTCRRGSNSLTICGYAGRKAPRHSPTVRSPHLARKQKVPFSPATSGNLQAGQPGRRFPSALTLPLTVFRADRSVVIRFEIDPWV